MAKEKIDFDKLKSEIAKSKNEKNMIPSNLGEATGSGIAPRDEFLNGLITSLQSGKATPSTNLIKVVENSVASKHGEVKKHEINENQTTRPTPPISKTSKVDMSPERDEQLFADLEKKRKQTLAESISNFQGKSPTGTPPAVNYNGTEYLTTPPIGTPMNENAIQVPQQINEGVLIENVKNIVNKHLTENLGPVFEEAIKGTIIEMYAVERIKEVLGENRDLIKEVVKDVIREIQAKNKAKAQS